MILIVEASHSTWASWCQGTHRKVLGKGTVLTLSTGLSCHWDRWPPTLQKTTLRSLSLTDTKTPMLASSPICSWWEGERRIDSWDPVLQSVLARRSHLTRPPTSFQRMLNGSVRMEVWEMVMIKCQWENCRTENLITGWSQLCLKYLSIYLYP